MTATGYSCQPDWFTREAVPAHGLSAFDVAVYVVLVNRANGAREGFASHALIARETGMSERRARASIEALVRCGLVSIVSRKTGKTNRYRVVVVRPDDLPPRHDVPTKGESESRPRHDVPTKDARAHAPSSAPQTATPARRAGGSAPRADVGNTGRETPEGVDLPDQVHSAHAPTPAREGAPAPARAPSLVNDQSSPARGWAAWDDLTPERQADARDWLRLATATPDPDLSEWLAIGDREDLAGRIGDARDWAIRHHTSERHPVRADVFAAIETVNARQVLTWNHVEILTDESLNVPADRTRLAEDLACWHALVHDDEPLEIADDESDDDLRERIVQLRNAARWLMSPSQASPPPPERIEAIECESVRRTVREWADSPH